MSCAKFTPGPWVPSFTQLGLVTAENGAVIAKCSRLTSLVNLEANGRLIAAAPEQHEANKASLMVLCALLDANDWHPNVRKDIEFAIDANRTAIARATGATP